MTPIAAPPAPALAAETDPRGIDGRTVTVRNMATDETVPFVGLDPRRAVMAAHAQYPFGVRAGKQRGSQYIGNYNTWEYGVRYAGLVRLGLFSVSCGDWAAALTERRTP